MNTPKTRQARRYSVNPNIPSRPDGVWRAGICNDKYIPCIARLLTYWPMVEDAMIGVLSDLLGTKSGSQGEPARQIFALLRATKLAAGSCFRCSNERDSTEARILTTMRFWTNSIS